ncbi:uncharacterized protein LOC127265486 [Andrographis paniculata]|uniref:uncharacterized protein LOC127265486 n=1 Tax=Andrographis paniculata TaxID=175694 RepID=UPI0021E73D9E|nr:uncharacterized protein LOC127265486 [Andrographis paniculata]XP_051151253.1 uncharacterized protein LOC127265486 [Andrographis paniculata]XP_051151254.1 uncharacterized protein LOC127265486 [Andrographis paniculata]XP_051151256.1 uncharacterized protein LOC127265486 [Andrographis paniculata]
MIDKSKKGKKRPITEENAAALLERYPLSTVLALLREVAHVAGEKIDWDKVVKNTATGISGARECQMLWRHLAYGETLTDQSVVAAANSLDDDSDLEYEVEAVPAVPREALTEAAACVKVLIDSGCLDNNPTSNLEAPLTINVPSSRAQAGPSDGSVLFDSTQGKNVRISVPVQIQPLSSGISSEKRPNNGASGADAASRKRRRVWSAEEDTKLTAAVKKYGERNWASIARGDFENNRKPSELSQRWSSLRKKQGNANAGTSSKFSETQLAAAHRAVSLALNMPLGGENLKTDHHFGRTGPLKPPAPTVRPPNPISTPDSMVKAAAVAAGARIATSADAPSIIDASRLQNVVRITTGASSAVKSPPPPLSSQLPSNVHFIRNGLARAPISTYTAPKPNTTLPVEAPQAQYQRSIKAATPAAPQPSPLKTPGVENATASIPSPAAAVPPKVAAASTSANESKKIVQETNQAEICKSASMNQGKASAPVTRPTQEAQMAPAVLQAEDTGKKIPDKQQRHEDSSSAMDVIKENVKTE